MNNRRPNGIQCSQGRRVLIKPKNWVSASSGLYNNMGGLWFYRNFGEHADFFLIPHLKDCKIINYGARYRFLRIFNSNALQFYELRQSRRLV